MADLSALIVTIESAAIAEAIDLREKVRLLEAELVEVDGLRLKADAFDEFAKWLSDPNDDRHPGEIMADYQAKAVSR